MDIASDIPIAIVEREDRHYRTIYANEAFRREVHSFGAKDIQDVLNILRKQNTTEVVQKCYERILYTEEHRETIEYNMMLNNYKVNTNVRFLSRMGNKAVYAFTTRNLTLHENL